MTEVEKIKARDEVEAAIRKARLRVLNASKWLTSAREHSQVSICSGTDHAQGAGHLETRSRECEQSHE